MYESLNPDWHESFSFRNIDDETLQEKYFEITVMDSDRISKDQMIGTVTIDISPLLTSQNEKLLKNLDAWYPIYHYNQGLRGYLQVQVKISLIKDKNTAKAIASTEVQFFCAVQPPPAQVKKVFRFVEELLEFKQRPDDKVLETLSLIESRSLKLQRKLARKVAMIGGNAVLGYQQFIDDEGSKSQRMVLRGYGTAVLLEQPKDNMVDDLEMMDPRSAAGRRKGAN